MARFVVRLSDLLPSFRQAIENARTQSGWDSNRLQSAIDSAFGFLGAFTSARVEPGDAGGDELVVLEFSPPELRDAKAAERRYHQATREAEAGRVRTALPELTRLVAEFPEVPKYHKALGQAYLVSGDLDHSEDELLRSLSLDPNDPDALTLLGNLYTKRRRPADAVPLYERSLSIQENVYALNNLGAAHAELGDTEKALTVLRKATQVDPRYPNTWFGIGLALSRLERLDVLPEAIAALDECLKVTERRERAPEVWDAARGLLNGLTKIEARERVSVAQEAIRRTLAALAADDVSVRMEEQPLRGVLAKLEVAWVHERAFHRLIVTPTSGPEREHHILHELQHLLLLRSAREANTNRWFASSAAGRETAIRSMESEIKRIERTGLPHDTIIKMTLGSLEGLLGQLFNFPIDLLIESRLAATYPDLRELFFESLKAQLDVSASIAHNAQLREATPKQIFRANTAMNAAFALWFEDQYPKRTDFVARFQKTDAWPLARKLYNIWREDFPAWRPGAEYDWIDRWADALGLRNWYLWRDGNTRDDRQLARTIPPAFEPHAPRADVERGSGRSEPLDRDRVAASTFFMLDAMKWADAVSESDVARVAAAAAVIGQSGISYLDPDSRYELPGYSDKPISGLHLLSVMYVLIKRLDPNIDQGIDLEEPFTAAARLYNADRG